MALDVQKKIANRRKTSDAKTLIEHHAKERNVMDDIDAMASWMASAVLLMLGENFEDITPSDADLRAGFQRSFRRMLGSLSNRSEKVVFLHEAIPGFTALAVKKQGWDNLQAGYGPSAPNQPIKTDSKDQKTNKQSALSKSKQAMEQNVGQQHIQNDHEIEEIDQSRGQAIECIINAYVQRTGNRVLNIEASDVTVVLFPVADLKHNLREMGFLG